MFLSISNKPILKQVPVHKLSMRFEVSIFIMVHRIPLIQLEHVIEYLYLALPSNLYRFDTTVPLPDNIQSVDTAAQYCISHKVAIKALPVIIRIWMVSLDISYP